jgi:glycerol-3-phosphate dehydrogenase
MAKIAVVGCGAMGSVYAALMVDAGHEVHAVTLWPDHAEAMASQGLRWPVSPAFAGCHVKPTLFKRIEPPGMKRGGPARPHRTV